MQPTNPAQTSLFFPWDKSTAQQVDIIMDASKNIADTTTTNKDDHYEPLDDETGRVNLMDSDSRCGCGPFKPQWLQRFVGPKLFTIHMGGVLAIYIGMSSYFSGILTTIERQFELSSSESGGLVIANDVAILCLVIVVSYYGHGSHRPRWMAGGGLIIALGFLVCSIPHFVSDPIDPRSIIVGGSGRSHFFMGASRGGICNTQDVRRDTSHNQSQVASDVSKPFGRYNGSACAGDTELGNGLVKWLVIGQIIVGIGAAPMFPLVISYIDDSVRKHELTSYTAVLFIMATLGPIAGYILSSKATSLYVDFDRVDPDLIPDIPQYDPRWIGAWWLGFLAGSVLLAGLSVPMFLYPKRMPVPNKVAAEKEPEPNTKAENNNVEAALADGIFKNLGKDTGLVDGMKNAIIAVKRLCFNVTLIFLILGGSAEMASSIIGRTFGVKYLITQFSTSPKEATTLTGGIIVPCVLLGQVVSAFICRRFKLDTKQCVIFIIIALCLCLITVPIKMFVGCPNAPVAGVNVPYPNEGGAKDPSAIITVFRTENADFQQSSLDASCNVDCGCPDEIFRPVCGVNGVTYISPCHAGCETLVKYNSTSSRSFLTKRTYSNCKCVAGSDGDNATSATSGQCRNNCDTSKQLTIYMVLSALSVFFMSLNHNPITFVTLRIVDSDDRSVAIGLKSLINKCLAFFPAPVYMGAIINHTCIYWQRTCGERGSCWLYNLVTLRFAFFGTLIALQFLGILCYVAMYVCLVRKRETNIQKLNDKDQTEITEATKF